MTHRKRQNGSIYVGHVISTSGSRGIKADVTHLAERLGADPKEGGFHPRFETRNHIIPLADSRYLEAVEVLNHPAAAKTPFRQAVRARSEMGGGWLGWAISVDDITPFEKRLERSAVSGSHRFPNGRHLEWYRLGIKGLAADPQLSFFLQWVSSRQLHPSFLTFGLRLSGIQIPDSTNHLSEWLGVPVNGSLNGIHLDLIVPNGHPGIIQVTFESPTKGIVVV